MRQFETYQHYKGGIYLKLCEALHTETEELLVVYACAVSKRVFARPKAMFEESVTTPTYSGPRFIRLPDNTQKDERKKIHWFPSAPQEK